MVYNVHLFKKTILSDTYKPLGNHICSYFLALMGNNMTVTGMVVLFRELIRHLGKVMLPEDAAPSFLAAPSAHAAHSPPGTCAPVSTSDK